MISLASSTPARLSPEPAEPRPAGPDTARAKGGFSAVLAQHEPHKADTQGKSAQAPRSSETAETADAETPKAGAAHGTALPETAKAGKTLPVALPDLADDSGEEPADPSDEAAAQAAAAEAIVAAVIVPHAPLPAAPNLAESAGETEAGAAGQSARTAPGRAALPQPVAAQAAPANEGETRTSGEKANGASVAVQVAPEPGAQAPAGMAMDTASDSGADGDAPAARPRTAGIERAAAQPAMADAARPADAASLVAAPATPAPALTASGEVRPSMPADALQDLTRIVDRLTAAREVFAPATEALSIDHAEFGELSLRFDQRRDGLLSVQLSASNPEAHRAVAQAVGAQAFHSPADGQPQGQSQTQSQTQSQAARGGPADRDNASANGHAAHRDQPGPEGRQPRERAPHVAQGGRQPAGIFA
ncbi:MAG: hypothetical protein J0I69_02630 [Altererythrobacter sp.]|nr:hypothetical protein [Altererythrobacter sp.]OJU60917.1 MAG: hypothetical protein BGO08_12380 [Altererythrobacter sp. 66-12]